MPVQFHETAATATPPPSSSALPLFRTIAGTLFHSAARVARVACSAGDGGIRMPARGVAWVSSQGVDAADLQGLGQGSQGMGPTASEVGAQGADAAGRVGGCGRPRRGHGCEQRARLGLRGLPLDGVRHKGL